MMQFQAARSKFNLFRVHQNVSGLFRLTFYQVKAEKRVIKVNNTSENMTGRFQNEPPSTGNRNLPLKTPKGTRDYGPGAMALRQRLLDQVVRVFRKHGAVPLDTPVFERKELLAGRYGEEAKLIYELQEQGGEPLALRYDLTVPFARYVALHNLSSMKRYQLAKVYRRDNPQPARGRLREFYQCDFDIAGTYDSMLPDAECVKVVCEVLHQLDIRAFVVKVNHRKLLDALLEVCGVPAEMFRTVCSSIDKLDKLPWDAVREELILQKGLQVETVEQIELYVTLHGGLELVDRLADDEKLNCLARAKEALDELRLLFQYCALFQVADRLSFDLSLARGLDYYTGVIYEAVLVGADDDNESTQAAFVGSVAGGGRYDNLVGTFNPHRKQLVPCVGVSIGVERLFCIMEARTREEPRTNDTQVYVASVHKGLHLKRLEILNRLWAADIGAEHSYKRSPKLLDQLQYCEQYRIPYAVIIGDGELARGVVKLRNVATRQEEEVELEMLIEKVSSQLLNGP
ncbi:histidine--tRNA ligase, cytoplasmic-like [Anopheles merus]|nr:histidine--tRNA ligase, cytoplasmic-like [Anopheles merus]